MDPNPLKEDLTSRLMRTLNGSQKMMLWVIACLLPGLLISTYFLGLGIIANVLTCCISVFICEIGIAKLRSQPLMTAWDGSGLVTAFLLGLALPPDISWHIVVFGAAFAVIFGKSLYGGLGHNPFNPAMVGYCALIVSFPLAMSTWPAVMDGLSGATALDTLKWRGAATIDEVWTKANGFGQVAGIGFEWIAASYLAGGLMLLKLKVIKWHGPVGLIASVALLSLVFYDGGGSASLGSPLFHLFSGSIMFAAFFIITDPVSSPDTAKGMLVFGIGVGLLTFIIRSIGAYPDGIAFAVLLMNALVPLYEQVRLRLL